MKKENKESILTQEYVKELFDYRDGFLYRIKLHPLDNNGKSKIGEKAGYVCKTHSGERRLIRIGKYSYYSSRLIFFYHNNWWPETVDHKDRNKSNENIDNLRAATISQNAKNYSKPKNGLSSMYKGVCFRNRTTKRTLKTTGEIKTWIYPAWVAAINVNGKKKNLGSFKTEIEAAKAYNKAASKFHKEFACLNCF